MEAIALPTMKTVSAIAKENVLFKTLSIYFSFSVYSF